MPRRRGGRDRLVVARSRAAILPARRPAGDPVAAPVVPPLRDPRRHRLRRGDATPAPTRAATAAGSPPTIRRRLRRAARAGLGPQRRDLGERRRAGRRPLRRGHRRPVRRRVDVPPRTGRLEGGAGRRWSSGCASRRRQPARRAVDDAASGLAGRRSRCPRPTTWSGWPTRGPPGRPVLGIAVGVGDDRSSAGVGPSGHGTPGPARIRPPRAGPALADAHLLGALDGQASNELYRTNLAKGQTGLSIAFDLPTQTGYDPDDPLARGEVGKVGVPVAHLGHMRDAARRHPAGRDEHVDDDQRHRPPGCSASTSPTPRTRASTSAQLRGTTQNDIVKEYLSRGTYIFPPEPSRRLIVDMIAFCAEWIPKWNPMNVCSYHLQEAGATPVQEIAYRLATAIDVLDAVRDSGQVARGPLPRGGRLDLVLRERRHPLRRGDVQDAGLHRAVGPHQPRALRRRPTPRPAASATACRSTRSASPRPSPRTTCSASCSRCSA